MYDLWFVLRTPIFLACSQFRVVDCKLRCMHFLGWGIELLNLKSAFFKLKSVVSILAARITLDRSALWTKEDRTKEVMKVRFAIWQGSSEGFVGRIIDRTLWRDCGAAIARCGRFNKWIGNAFTLWRWEGGFCRFDCLTEGRHQFYCYRFISLHNIHYQTK